MDLVTGHILHFSPSSMTVLKKIIYYHHYVSPEGMSLSWVVTLFISCHAKLVHAPIGRKLSAFYVKWIDR